MQFKLRRVGTSWGVLIPKGFVDAYREGDFIGLAFEKMPVEVQSEVQSMVSNAVPIEPPEEAEEIERTAVLVKRNPLRKTACKKHHGSYSCGCKD